MSVVLAMLVIHKHGVGILGARAGVGSVPVVPAYVWLALVRWLAVLIVAGSVVHALLIEGTMGTWSKSLLCALVMAAAVKLLHDLRLPAELRRLARSAGRKAAR